MASPPGPLAKAIIAHNAKNSGAVRLAWGVINAIVAGPPATVNLYIDGSTSLTNGVRYDATYSPAVNDVVYLLKQPLDHGNDYVIIGKLA